MLMLTRHQDITGLDTRHDVSDVTHVTIVTRDDTQAGNIIA